MILPCVEGHWRYLTHRAVQENFPDLNTISVGTEPFRRTLIYHRSGSEGGEQSSENKSQVESKKCSENRASRPRVVKKSASLDKSKREGRDKKIKKVNDTLDNSVNSVYPNTTSEDQKVVEAVEDTSAIE